jgi:eukaryotic-like serine/threonine-protein kinase
MGSTRPDTIGRYKIVESIGGGGMGTLYLARDPKIANRQVVIKLLREGFDNPELRERFAREADAAGGLRHANVVTIFDVGEFDGQPFIAMDYIRGETLIGLIQRNAKLSLGRKLQLIDELCAGLHYAHRAGVVHRDIKPANIMVDQDGVLKILDFGIARLGGSGMTQAGMVMGTLNYMSPEQMEGLSVDARADQFSAGAVFYELLSYKRAFPGELPSVVHKIMTGTREPLATLLPDADPSLIAIVDRCMAHLADDRYADMQAVRRDLAPVRQRVAADEQKHIHLRVEEARSAIGRGDFEAALRACEDALVLDSEYGPVLEVQQEARAALTDRRVKGYLTHARSELDRGALTAAERLVEQALGENAASSDALAAREAIGEARRRVSEAQERARVQASMLTLAQQQFDNGSFELALQTLDEALAIDAGDVGHQKAQALKDRVGAAEAARRKAEQAARERAEREARARSAVDAARQQFLAGQHAAALSLLERFTPAHSMVTAALADLRVEMQEIERRRLEAERRRAEEERRRRERQAQEEEEERRRAAEAARQRLEEEARRLAIDAQEVERRRLEAEAELRRKEAEERRRNEEETRREREEAERRRAADEARRRLEEEQRRVMSDATVHIERFNAVTEMLPSPAVDPMIRIDPPAPVPAAPVEPTIRLEQRRTSATVPATVSSPSSRRVTWTVAAIVAILVLTIAGVLVRRASAPGAAETVVFQIIPWAKIDAITPKTGGQPVGGANLVTPCVVALPPGEYHVRATNPNFPPLEFDLTVKSGGPQAVRYRMPGFNPEQEVTAIVGK